MQPIGTPKEKYILPETIDEDRFLYLQYVWQKWSIRKHQICYGQHG